MLVKNILLGLLTTASVVSATRTTKTKKVPTTTTKAFTTITTPANPQYAEKGGVVSESRVQLE